MSNVSPLFFTEHHIEQSIMVLETPQDDSVLNYQVRLAARAYLLAWVSYLDKFNGIGNLVAEQEYIRSLIEQPIRIPDSLVRSL